MAEDVKNDETKNQGGSADCGCEGNCCPPPKKKPYKTILFAVIILAALGIVAFKLTHKPPPEAVKKACCPSGSTAGCDTTKKAGTDTTKKAACDTTKNSSCCPKK